MKIYLAALSLAFIIASCNNSKPKEDTNPVVNIDSAAIVQDTGAYTAPIDSMIKEGDFGGAGDLLLGLSQSKTIELLGQPESKSKAEQWDADGLIHQDWFYKSKGIELNMESEKLNGEQKIFSVTITQPCTFKTKKNMGIGSTYNEVMAAYEKEIDKSASDKSVIVIGSVYGGIIINFENDKAVKLFFGAAAE